MIVSMTGFGKAELTKNGYTVAVEVKSVNNRFCDISIYLPPTFKFIESQLKELINQNIQRGKINISIRVEKQDETKIDVSLNPVVVQSYVQLLTDLKKYASIEEPLTINHLLSFKDIFEPKEESPEEIEVISLMLSEATQKALDELNIMRRQEGSHLSADLSSRISFIEQKVESVKSRAALRIPEIRVRMQERLKQLLDDDQFDANRMEMELALLSDRLDITEEIVRMGSHICYFRKAIEAKETVGRKLNFLIQEMNREINTMGSKCNDVEIAHEVVEMKEQLEIIREQIQNIE